MSFLPKRWHKSRLKKQSLLIIGALLLVQSGYLLSLRKTHIGIIIPFLIALCFIFISFYWQIIQDYLDQHPTAKTLWHLAWLVFAVWLLSVAVFFIILQHSKQHIEHIPPIDAMIVLGSGVSKGQPTTILAHRLDAAAALALQQPKTRIVISGGFTTDPQMSEADVMAHYLTTHYHLSKDRFLLDSQSKSTSTNFKYSASLLAQAGLSKEAPIAVITSDFHTLRAQAIAKKQGFQHIYLVGAPTPRLTRYPVWLREYFAFIHGKILQEF